MSGVELKPCGDVSGDNILVPLGTTTVGRGPFLGISDKRVSRNHAILEIEDGTLKVKPIHVNPTYFSKNSDTKLKPLKKDEWKELENGNRISLTPDQHIFEVIIDDRPVQQSITQSPRSLSGNASPLKTLKDSPLKLPTDDKQEDTPSPLNRKPELSADNNESTAEEETNDGQEEKKERGALKENKEIEEYKSAHGDDEEEEEVNLQHSEEDNKVYAKPLEKKRELPAWMLNLPSDQQEQDLPKAVKKPKAPAKTTSRAKKRASEEVSDEEDVKPPAKKRGAPARTTKRAAPVSYKEDDEDDAEEEDVPPPPELKKRTSSRGRQTTRVNYVDDIEIDDEEDDEEFIATKDEEDESDWEEETSPKKKGKGKSKSPRGAKGKKRRGRRSYSDEESSEEDVYIPKPTKRTAKILSNSQRSTDNEETATSRRGRRNQDDNKENGDDALKPCPYASKCYRKNPLHFKEFSHPGDSDNESEMPEEDEDDKPECPYGLNCYRTNLEHKKQFKHPLSSDRPKRQAKRGRKRDAENGSDDGEPNTYDYEDSFLDDEEEETPKGKDSDDSDWDPGSQSNSEDISQLVREAKDYVKNKKMQKPV